MKLSRKNFPEFIAQNHWKITLGAILVIAIFFRFWQLSTIAPGLGQDEATLAVRALAQAHHPGLSIFNEARGLGSSLYISLVAIAVRLFGATILGLRVVPALLGVLSVGFMYLWVNSWFGRRVGLVSALLYAVTPWIVTASRRGDEHGLILLTVPLILWLFTRAFQEGSRWRYGLAGVILGLGLTKDLGSWVVLIVLLIIGAYLIVRRRRFIKHTGSGIAVSLVGLAVVLLIGAGVHFQHPSQTIAALGPDVAIAHQSADHWLTSVTKTILAFNVHGDDNFSNNVGGAPLLNFFVGLMLVMGILVSLSRFNRSRYGSLLALTVFLLIPAALSPYVPDGRAALVAAPIIIALAAIGISYLLDIWYGTFPINSAARSIGTLPIILLLLITIYQGYKQYFIAWAGSPEVYEVSNEQANAIAGYLDRTNYSGQRFVAVDQYSHNVLDYLTYQKATYTAINTSDVDKVPADGQIKQIIITSAVSADSVNALKTRFPKARLSTHYSDHDDNNELFEVYEVLK
jgi:4-amino-4-deoxy-L-arabinose transferase-like glycosyltransferase